MPRYGKPYYPKRYSGWRETAWELVPTYEGESVARPVSVEVLFVVPRARTSTLIVPVGDGDNYEKALYDLLQRKEYLADDKWITTCTWRKRFCPTGEDGYTQITIFEEVESIDLEEGL